jgi:tetratricopeptide (TPR) repeat protein
VLNTNPPPDLLVTQVAGDLVIRPAQEMAREPAPTVTPAVPDQPRIYSSRAGATNLPPESPAAAADREKKSFLAKLNPFKSTPKTAKSTPTPIGGTVTGMVYAARETEAARATPVPVRTFDRYAFLSPVKPGTGNRVAADRSLQRGYAAHQAGKYTLAITEYQQAVKADPGCFEAYYNIGLAAQENRDFKRALQAYEYALAVQPDSADARYNFGLALKQAEYPMDAADQLSTLLKQTPNDVRVHLLLGNIYSQLLNQPSFARDHYQRVLELEPRHSEAARIRYWLAANP